MRRSIATLVLPLAALSACATAGGEGTIPNLRPGFESGGVASREHALRVRLHEAGGDLRVSLNRQAHIAVFQVVPGEGVALVSPFASRELVRSGSTTVLTRFEANRFWRYDDAFRTRYASHGALGPQSIESYTSVPRHLLVIASDRPLQLGRFLGSRGTLRRALGTSRYSSVSSRRVMDDLLATVLAPQPEGSWDADVLTVWPRDYNLRLPHGNLYRVRCRNGATVWAPLELMDAACRDPERVAPPLQRPDTTGRDSSGVRAPGGRRPQPEPVNGADAPPIRAADGGVIQRLRPTPDAPGERPFLLSELRRDLENRRTQRSELGAMTPAGPRIEHMREMGRMQRPQSGGSGSAGHQAPRVERPSSGRTETPRAAEPPRERPAPERGERTRPATEP
ncbi:MAG: hypothetical protein AVDCRST_MAG68-1639 [uncultured Gemmatimonadetes bacterium]|uniref:DUF4412 domain-containing protein n=1 Tax=uncultured Gemmatimonadota bacterium TaxID=203437 RepID=A0A6J4KUA1_9BACT|nr:MAG: hypothetical protein AVDCRST_MAG68-1639 [uncultured Gemmatimonadota bacterium]